jgi:FlaA1/EpsC-like NDP-sugar epimerase|tara:strand:- start:939 stop:1058 length:120 start_codon:yes stop_codon:yes gene_type:complete
MLEDKKLLITGGTGSFGNAFLKKALKENEFSEIRFFLII